MFKLINFYGPEDSGSGSGSTGEMSVTELENFLAEDEVTDENETETIDLDIKSKGKEKDKEKEKEDSSSQEDDEETENEDEGETELEDEFEKELQEPNDEELDPSAVMPSRKEMLTKYPKLFKDFPELEKAFYRDRKYTELFPSVKEAESASAKAETWDKLEGDLRNGNIRNVLQSVAETDKNAFYQIVDDILINIKDIDEAAATHLYGGVVKDVIQLMVENGNTEETKHIKTAAQILHQFIFGPRKWEPHQPLGKKREVNPQVDKLTEREREFVKRQFNSARGEISSRVDNTINATIERHIDPKDSMTPYVKTKAVKDVFDAVQEQIKQDKRFQGVLGRLWDNAARKEFDEPSKKAIRDAIITKAKQLLPTALINGRKVALGAGRLKPEQKSEGTPKTQTSHKTGKTAAQNRSGGSDKEKARAIPKNVSTRDFLLND